MRSGTFSSTIAFAALTFGASSALTHSGKGCSRPMAMTLSALHTASGPWGSRNVPSRTSRESAFNVEWEPMSELERRLEDGVNYEHLPAIDQAYQIRKPKTSEGKDDGIPLRRAVFVGYRYTEDEYNRLRSADPTQ